VKVLLVDDHRMFTELLVQLLGGHQDIVISGVARTAAEALIVAREDPPDVAVVDYRLPDSNGATLALALRREHPQTHLVMLTGFQDEATIREAVAAGCSGFVSKDRAVDELLVSLRTVHAGGASISPDILTRLLPSLRKDTGHGPTNLTPRELEVLQLLVDGSSNRVIAAQLFISNHTVRNHVQRILTKLGVHSKLEAVAAATRIGLVRPAEPSSGSGA
jgi:DNA-binding NarL/FixJ family response regulator